MLTLTHLNLTGRPLPDDALDRARQKTLDQAHPLIRPTVAENLTHRVVGVHIGRTPGDTVAAIPLTDREWEHTPVIPWVDLRQDGARALVDAVRARRGYLWPVAIKHPDRPWWLIFSWGDRDAIVGGGE